MTFREWLIKRQVAGEEVHLCLGAEFTRGRIEEVGEDYVTVVDDELNGCQARATLLIHAIQSVVLVADMDRYCEAKALVVAPLANSA